MCHDVEGGWLSASVAIVATHVASVRRLQSNVRRDSSHVGSDEQERGHIHLQKNQAQLVQLRRLPIHIVHRQGGQHSKATIQTGLKCFVN